MGYHVRRIDPFWKASPVVLIIAIAGALVAAFGLTRLMATLLYGITATDELTFATVPFIIVGVTVFAGYLPSRRAANTDPMITLRCE